MKMFRGYVESSAIEGQEKEDNINYCYVYAENADVAVEKILHLYPKMKEYQAKQVDPAYLAKWPGTKPWSVEEIEDGFLDIIYD